MTVYIVLRFLPDDFELHGVFVNEQDAQQYAQEFAFCDDDYYIEIMETELHE